MFDIIFPEQKQGTSRSSLDLKIYAFQLQNTFQGHLLDGSIFLRVYLKLQINDNH